MLNYPSRVNPSRESLTLKLPRISTTATLSITTSVTIHFGTDARATQVLAPTRARSTRRPTGLRAPACPWWSRDRGPRTTAKV